MANDPATVLDKHVTAPSGQKLRSLQGVRLLYFLPTDPLVEEVLIPGFQSASNVERGVNVARARPAT